MLLKALILICIFFWSRWWYRLGYKCLRESTSYSYRSNLKRYRAYTVGKTKVSLAKSIEFHMTNLLYSLHGPFYLFILYYQLQKAKPENQNWSKWTLWYIKARSFHCTVAKKSTCSMLNIFERKYPFDMWERILVKGISRLTFN